MDDLSDYDKGIKLGFEMALKLSSKRMERIEKALETMIGWVTLSQYGLSPKEAADLYDILHPKH